jgi:hypothetical protein
MTTKPFYKSVTMWVNFVILVIAFFDKEVLGLFGISEQVIDTIMLAGLKVTAFLNMVVRYFFTDSSLRNGK